MLFKNRIEAADQLASLLSEYKDRNPIILAIPRGAVPIAQRLKQHLGGELDILLVHKFTMPQYPEFALGSVSEDGSIHLGEGARQFSLSEQDIQLSALAEIRKLQSQRRLWTPFRAPLDVEGRLVIIVDDGIATGATMLAAIESVRMRNAGELVIAAPVASARAASYLDNLDSIQASHFVAIPENFMAVSQFYEEFDQVSDEDVIRILKEGDQHSDSTAPAADEVIFQVEQDKELKGFLTLPESPLGLVIFSHGSGSSRFSPRNTFVAEALQRRSIGTLLIDLLLDYEDDFSGNRFDIERLTSRLVEITRQTQKRLIPDGLPIGYFGASTGAAAALSAAAELKFDIHAVVSRGGRPDLAAEHIEKVVCPTLFLVGELDTPVIHLNRESYNRLTCERDMIVIPGASHLFEEPGTLEQVTEISASWFEEHLGSPIPESVWQRRQEERWSYGQRPPSEKH